MDNTEENINNNKTNVEESTKLENKMDNYDTFKDDDERLNPTDNEASSQSLVYFKLMNKRHSKYHIISTSLYFLSLIALEFLVLQVAFMLRTLILTTRVELITLLFLIMSGVACGWILKHVLMEEMHNRRSILVSSVIAMGLTCYVVVTKSAFILYFFYPLVSVAIGVVLFNSQQMFEEYYMTDCTKKEKLANVRSNKNIFTSLTLFSSIIVLLCIMTVSSGFFSNWNLGLLFFAGVLLTIHVLSYFAKDSPLSLYKNDPKDFTSLFESLEFIREKKLELTEKDQLVGEIKTVLENQNSASYVMLFRQDVRKETVLFILLIFCSAYVNMSLIMSVPNLTITTTPLNEPDRMGYYFFRMFVLLVLASPGKLLGSLLLKWVKTHRKFLTLALFASMFTFSLLLTIFIDLYYLFAGFTLLFGYASSVVLANYAYEFYDDYLNEKAVNAYYLAYYVSAALTMIIFEGLASVSYTTGFGTTIGFTVVGAIVSAFLSS